MSVGSADWLENSMAEWRRREAEQTESAKTAMYDELIRRPGIVTIEVEYDGHGDEGNVESAVCTNADGVEITIDQQLEDLVSNYVYAMLPGGWEINEGSFGTCTIDVRAQKARFDHKERIEEVNEVPFED